MKKSLLNISITALLAATSTAALAGTVTIPNTFTSGTKAVAAEVNANFTAVKSAVDGNAGDIATNATAITTNATAIATKADASAVTSNDTDIAANAAAITANSTSITANSTAIATKADASAVTSNDTDIAANATAISANTTAIATKADASAVTSNDTDIAANAAAISTNATDIAALQTSTDCPSDMVSMGRLCVDKYEASVWNAATAGTQISGAASGILSTCALDGSDCVDGGANPIYARSVIGVEAAYDITYYQAAIACANVGKRLPTVAEWLAAAAGTATGNGDGSPVQCNNIAGGGGARRNTSEPASCVPAVGAYDMVGNVYEITADIHFGGVANGLASANDAKMAAMGGDFADNGALASPLDAALFVPNDTGNTTTGFRCVK